MRHLRFLLAGTIAAGGIAFGSIAVFGAADVRGQDGYEIRDAIRANENIKLTWTKHSDDFLPNWELLYRCTGDPAFQGLGVGATVEFDFRNLMTELAGKACEFRFFAPAEATDWRQEIIGPDGTSTVLSGNIKKDSPWTFEELALLPDVAVRIPDLAPIAPGNPDLTIYTAVNLDLYMTENPAGFLCGNWFVGQTLADLGVKIINGEVLGLQGIYWATTPFEFNPDPAGRGFTPVGGDGNLLDSALFEYEIEVLQQHHAGVVGGITEHIVDGSGAPASASDGSGSSAPLYAAIAGAAAAVVALATAGCWYARRRFRQRRI